MRLSPVLATVVAIGAPLGGSLSVNAQNSQVVVPTTEKTQQPVAISNPELGKTPQSVVIPTKTKADVLKASLKTAVVVPTNWDKTQQSALLKSVVPISPATTSKFGNLGTTVTVTAQKKPSNPTPTPTTPKPLPPLPEPVPENFPTTQQKPTQPNNPNQQPTQPTQPNNPNQQPTQPNNPNQQPTQPTQPNNPNQQPTQPNIDFGQPNQGEPNNNATEPRVLVSEVVVKPQSGQLAPELEQEVYRVIRTQAGKTTTKSQLQEDINAIFATGFFSNVQATPEDTPLGVRVSFVVAANPVLTKVQIQANPGTNVPSALPEKEVDEIFKGQYGRILNLRELQEGIKQLTKRYQDQGYVLANIIGAPQVGENGVVNLQIAEGVVENIRVRFLSKDGQETTEKGDPIRGRTRNYIITREIELKPGKTFNRNIIQKDLQRVFALGLFEDVKVSLDPSSDPSKVDVVVNVVERNSGSIAAGAGISSASGLFGTISYQEQNLGGRNQKLGTEFQVGVRELLFDVRFTDPWIAGDPYRTSYTVNAFRRRSISLIFDGKDDNVETFNPSKPNDDGDRPRVTRTGGGVTFTRPLSKDPFKSSEWVASAGLQYQRVSTLDSDGDVRKVGRVSKDPSRQVDLTTSGEGKDDLLLLQLGASRDRRNNPLQPTKGSFLRVGVDQSVPVGLGNIFLTRVRGSYSQYVPVKFTNFTKGPQALAFNLQAGTVLGDLPPYEAFSLGGSNSVRGYEEGALGSGRSYVQASVEYRFPVFSVVSGALFFDVGSDLGTSTRPADVLNKNGTGYGYGLGVRVQSPLGPIRIDYGVSDDGDSRINFGIGERF